MQKNFRPLFVRIAREIRNKLSIVAWDVLLASHDFAKIVCLYYLITLLVFAKIVHCNVATVVKWQFQKNKIRTNSYVCLLEQEIFFRLRLIVIVQKDYFRDVLHGICRKILFICFARIVVFLLYG